jgi:beta-galactosidase
MKMNDLPDRFNWQAGMYTQESLTAAKHPCGLLEDDSALWRVDAESVGVRSGTCGPGVKDEYQVKCREMKFEVRLEAIEGSEHSL